MIIVNMMWFGSLTISLMAASYGMLVKQWLREYLANRDASPLARLRIRCFRYPALAKWKVFEIVAILPLLLQLALGLFFVGLCYFASSIHPAIQWTVIPLVSIWASLLISATLAPVVSARCPYKTTFLKGVMTQLRVAKLTILHKAIHSDERTNVEEEDDIANNDTTDFDVVAQVDVTQADDGLISPALVDLGRQHPGPNLVSFIFTILGHRDSSIKHDDVDNLLHIQRVSTPLLRAVAAALVEALSNEHRRIIAFYKHDMRFIKWDRWVQDSSRVLLLMSKFTWFTSQFNKVLSDCLSAAHPDFIDGLMEPALLSGGWSGDQKTAFIKAIIQLIDPSSMEIDNPRPLKLYNLSVQSWGHAIDVFRSSIFPQGMSASSPAVLWNEETKFGFRGVFTDSGEFHHTTPENICQAFSLLFTTDTLVEKLLSPISSLDVLGHGRSTISYAFRVIQIHREIPVTFDLSYLSERSWTTVNRLLIDALKDELQERTDRIQEGPKWDDYIFNAIYAILSTVQHPPSADCIEIITSLFQLDPELLSNSLMTHFSKFGCPPWSIAVSTILRVLIDSDFEQLDPWSTELNISTTSSQPDMFASIAAACLAALQASTPDNSQLRWVSWATHILLSCVDVSESFSGSTILTIDKLTFSHAYLIICSLPQNWKDRQFQIHRLWNLIRLLSSSRQMLFIMQLWPKMFWPADSIITSRLLEMYATEQNQTTTEVFLHAPPEFQEDSQVLGNFIVCHLGHARALSGAARKGCIDELEPFLRIECNVAWLALSHISADLNRIGHPGWPEWMKEFIIEDLTEVRSISDLPRELKECLCSNATEFVALLASHNIDYLDHLPDNLLVYRNWINRPLYFVFRTFSQHPEPLSPEKAESCLMRLFVNAETDKPAWTFSTSQYFSNNDPPPRYACVSIILRVLQYYLSSRAIQIPQKDNRSPLDLSELEKEVWDDISAAAAEVLNRDAFYEIEVDYFGGRKTYDIARMDAIMILLAESPHPFCNDLSYQVLDQEFFFHWEDNPSVQSDTRQELEKRRQSRIEEGRKRRHLGQGVATGDHHEDGTLQIGGTTSVQPIEEGHVEAKNEGDVQGDQKMGGSNRIHRDGLQGGGGVVENMLEELEDNRANACAEKYESSDDEGEIDEGREREPDGRKGEATS